MTEWKDIWTLAEVNKHDQLHSVSFELLAWGRSLADDRNCRLCSVVLADKLQDEELQELIYHGADVVYIVKHPQLEHFIPESDGKVLTHLVETYHPEVFIAAATTTGRTVLPYVAVRTRAGLTADCTELSIDPETGNLLQTRPAIGGNIMATIKTPEARPQMSTVRPKSARPLERDLSRTGEIIHVTDVPEEAYQARMKLEKFVTDSSNEMPIEDADIIVSGGKGMANSDNFVILEQLAHELGGAVGVSRAAIDQGWRPYSQQVGLSGKTVAPSLYIACGISGAVQHIVGMSTAELIIAINSDTRAPIFDVADVGVVGDLFVMVPLITELIRQEKAKEGQENE
ncbi:MAG: electron transfer flavoprotein subunit alpha/FixB family protein [Anaerolineaceae bacterium]|nr:electron transfer flavoprotein subunit alpha/FixB family protein [Anaerolineaceae bacterium]